MLIISNCMSDKPDEGCIKVANSLVKRIKKIKPETLVISYERKSSLSDYYLKVNKLLLNKDLFGLIRKYRENILYIPFPARSLALAIRIVMISIFAGKPISVLMTMTGHYGKTARILLKISKAHIFTLSRNTLETYEGIVGKERTIYIKTGVDIKKFIPIEKEEKLVLKEKYGLDPNKKTVLHVGHLKKGRNIAQLKNVDSQYQVLLVVSTLTKEEQDLDLRKQLEACENIKIIDSYIPDIQEIYQLADVYVFPVIDKKNCIDVPLSCIEAAACGIPVITTSFGEMQELVSLPGFYLIKEDFEQMINYQIRRALEENINTRTAVLEYDWTHAVRLMIG